MKPFIAVYRRHYERGTEEFDSLPEAASFLQRQSDDGAIFPCGIYETESGKTYIEECHVIGVEKLDFRENVLLDIRETTPGFSDTDFFKKVETVESFDKLA
jgi:hypothetical protein